jgi:uncharacterized membrane protein
MVKRILLGFLVAIVSFVSIPTTSVSAQENSPAPYERAKVTSILEEQKIPVGDDVFFTQKVELTLRESGKKVELHVGSEFQPLNEQQILDVNTEVIVTQQTLSDGSTEYVIVDVYRLPILFWLLAGFFVLVIVVAQIQGLFSIVGMTLSLGIVSGFIVPQILAGQNPVLVALVGAVAIATLTIYLSHGFNAHSNLALLSMIMTLGLVALLSSMAVQAGQFAGLGSEEAYFLQFGETAKINLQGLLLGGILLGALGILDDICVAQISIVFQLKEVNEDLTFSDLYARGLRVGKDHVASLVNTLILAYTAANLPLFLLFTINQSIPLWVTLNNEIIAEEVVRTLVGSIGLVLAVPIATLLAAYVASHFGLTKGLAVKHAHSHHHHGHRH